MAITPDQVVENIQRQFSWFHGNMPRQIALSLWLVWFVLGGPFFHLGGPASQARRVANRLAKSNNNLMRDLGRLRGVIYAGYYGHWQASPRMTIATIPCSPRSVSPCPPTACTAPARYRSPCSKAAT